MIKIAIHHRTGSFSDRWIEYCKSKHINYKIVNCLDSDIIKQLEDCDGLMFHWYQWDSRDILFVRQLIYSIEKQGKVVFPSYDTCWHFDDKVGQKYLLESIHAPLVNSYVFYDQKTAEEWTNNAIYPKVFKLRGGAGSQNVKLVKNKRKAIHLIRIAFGRGFFVNDKIANFQDRLTFFKSKKNIASFFRVLKGLARIFYPSENDKMRPRDKGYIYFQDFLPNNSYDTRLIVIGNKCIGLRRFNRDNDFRASGSGKFAYDPSLFNIDTIKTAFNITRKLGAQSLAFDFIKNDAGQEFVLEMSYAFTMGKVYDDCPGYWNSEGVWHMERVNPQHYIIEDFIKCLVLRKDNVSSKRITPELLNQQSRTTK